MKRRVKWLQSHVDLFYPGGGSFGKSLPSSVKSIDDLHMVKDGEGVIATGSIRGIKFEMWIPSGSIALATLFPEEKE